MAAAQAVDTGSKAETVAKPPNAAPAFPLAVRPGKRYLEDADGRPFLIHGDTAWSLIADLTREDVDLYLEDRRARGFNTLLVNLIESRFATNAPANAYGQLPFQGRPFEAVVALVDLPLPCALRHERHEPRRRLYNAQRSVFRSCRLGAASSGRGGISGAADAVLRRLRRRQQGWYAAMVANGPERLRAIRRISRPALPRLRQHPLGARRRLRSTQKRLVRAIAEGIATFDPRALHTAHCAPETAAIEYWQGEHWLDVNNVYTYGPVYAAAVGAVCPARTHAVLPDRERLRERARGNRAAPAHAGLPGRSCPARPARSSATTRSGISMAPVSIPHR